MEGWKLTAVVGFVLYVSTRCLLSQKDESIPGARVGAVSCGSLVERPDGKCEGKQQRGLPASVLSQQQEAAPAGQGRWQQSSIHETPPNVKKNNYQTATSQSKRRQDVRRRECWRNGPSVTHTRTHAVTLHICQRHHFLFSRLCSHYTSAVVRSEVTDVFESRRNC